MLRPDGVAGIGGDLDLPRGNIKKVIYDCVSGIVGSLPAAIREQR
jgi:hypothetical protein